MKIAMIHFRVGELDGVSLEMDKWCQVLEKRFDHNVTYLAGSLGQAVGYAIPELAMDFQPNSRIFKNAFSSFKDYENQEAFKQEVRSLVNQIKSKVASIITENPIDLLIPNNIFSLPINIPASIALFEIIEELSLPVIIHNHDFFWERTIYSPTNSYIQEILDKYFPPDLPSIKHVVINSLAQIDLKNRRGIDSTVVPNVFRFDEGNWIKDEYNTDLRKTLRIDENDITFLQATRIVERKGIELVIDLISELNQKNNLQRLQAKQLYDGRKFRKNNRMVLVMPNLIEDTEYKLKLEEKLKEKKVEYRFCNEYFAHERYQDEDRLIKKYSLWDSYVHADFVTYPSLQEGWGNQFLEAIRAKLPIIIFEYDVYKKDIGPLGFNTISLGSEIQQKDEQGLVKIPSTTIKAAAEKVIDLLQNSTLRINVTEKNYSIGQENLSLIALGDYLAPLLDFSPK